MYWKKTDGIQKVILSFAFLTFFLLLLPNVFAVIVTITPIANSNTSVTPNQYCGQTTQTSFTIINDGNGGIVCYYYTNEDTTKRPLMSSCLGKQGQSGTYNVPLSMPVSSSKTITVQLECYEFWTLFGGNQCQNSYATNYSAAVSKATTCSNANGIGCSGSIIGSRNFYLSCAELKFSLTPSQSTVTLYSGQSQEIKITVTNTMLSDSITCNQGIGTIAAGGSNSNYKITVQPPSSGSETATVECTWKGGNSVSKSEIITVKLETDPCKAALSDARNAISDVQTTITNAQSKIQEATQLGADVTSATASLNKANSELSSAQTSVATSQTTCDSGDKTTGVTQANTAKASATQARTYATDALNSAQQSITTFTQKKTEASNKISDANSAIDTTIIAVNRGEDSLNNATQLSSVLPEAVQGLDLVKEKANINTARLKIDQAKNYIKEAQTVFDQKNFDLAKSKATSAIDLANEANKLSTESYGRINAVLLTLGEAGRAVLAATNEISQTDEILSKMDYVIKNVEKYGVNLAEAKEITSTGQTNIDTAKDLLSQARNRLQAGVSEDAVNKAITARDKAAEPTNRLNRIVDSMSSTTQDGLKKAYAEAEQKITNAENAVNGAANTFGATQSEVLVAQDSLAKAKSQLANASSLIDEIESATGLQEFVSKSTLAFSALQEVEQQAKLTESHASSAKMGLIIKIVIPAAGVVGAAGGGFLIWRLRRKKRLSIGKVEKEIEKEVEETWKMFCKTCKKEYSTLEKFCSVCGKKLKKVFEEKPKRRKKK